MTGVVFSLCLIYAGKTKGQAYNLSPLWCVFLMTRLIIYHARRSQSSFSPQFQV